MEHNQKILYHITKWYEGTAYKNINFMRDNFGGFIIKDSIPEVEAYIKREHPDMMVVRGDTRDDYRIAMRYKIPYLLIEHDINSLRRGFADVISQQERQRVENASAMILTSEEHAEYFKKLAKESGWRLPYFKVIHTRPLKRDIEGIEPKKKLEGLNLVYAGGIMPGWERRKQPYGYRCYHEIFKAFIKASWGVHIYSASYNTGKLSEYKGIGCRVYENLPYKALLQEMTRYTAGFHGYNQTGVPKMAYQYTQMCVGNKIWDYLAAGIPTIGFQGGKGMKIYKDKWGIVIKDLEEDTIKNIPEKLEKLKITEQMREENVMDKDIGKYKKLIKAVMKEAENKERKVYFIPEYPIKTKDNIILKNKIRVRNKGAHSIYRGGYIFPAGKTSGELVINMRTFREIKAHVSLIIEMVT